MQPTAKGHDARTQASRPKPTSEALIVQGVVTHERLMEMVKERNPIIARLLDQHE